MKEVIGANAAMDADELICLVNLALKRSEIYLALKGVCAKIGFSQSAIKSWVKVGKFPEPVTIKNKPRWIESEVDTWIERQNPSRLVAVQRANQVAKDAAAITKNL